MTACRHCHEQIAYLLSPTPELGGDWWHIDEHGERSSETCCVSEMGNVTILEFAEP